MLLRATCTHRDPEWTQARWRCAFPRTEHGGLRGRPSWGGGHPACCRPGSILAPPPSSPHSATSTHSVPGPSCPGGSHLVSRISGHTGPPVPSYAVFPRPRRWVLPLVVLPTAMPVGTRSGKQHPAPQPRGQPADSAVTTPLTTPARTQRGEHVSPETWVGGPGRWAAELSQGTTLPRKAIRC